VADFGFTQLKEDFMQDKEKALGSPYWMSPELLTAQPFGANCDVYAYGIMLWQMYTRLEPFQHHNDLQSFRIAICRNGERPPVPEDCPAGLARLMEDCWKPDPFDAPAAEKRPSMSRVIERLNPEILASIAPPSAARDVWQKLFNKSKSDFREAVPVVEFTQKVYGLLRSSRIKYPKGTFTGLRTVLGKPQPDGKVLVKLADFILAASAFGTFWEPTAAAAAVLEDIRLVSTRDWFHGFVSKDEAERRISAHVTNAREDTSTDLPLSFLVRITNSVPDHPFALSTVSEERGVACIHRRIYHRDGEEYHFSGRKTRYAKLHDVIECCSDSRIKNTLGTPCPQDVRSVGAYLGYEDGDKDEEDDDDANA
jgi:serine/threonine protein kinase